MKFYLSIPQFLYRFGLICLLFSFFTKGVLTQNSLSAQSAAEIQSQAKFLSKQWNGEAIRRSIDLFIKAADHWEKLGNRKKAAQCLRDSAELGLLISDYEMVFALLEKALQIDVKTADIEGKSLTLSILSRASNQKGDVKKSEYYYKQALDSAKLTASDEVRANALFSAAEYNSAYGKLNETIKLYEEALAFAEKTGNKDLIARILINIGYSYARQDNPVYGLQKVKESLAKWQEIDEKRGQALANFGIGFLYTLMDEKQNALDFYRKSEAMFPDDIDWLEKAKLFNGIATIYESYDELKLGESYRQKALELYEKAKYPYGQLPTLISLARLSNLKGDKVSGQILFEKALTLANQTNDRFHLAIIKENIGNFDLADGNYDKAIANFRESLAVYKSLDLVLPRVENSLGIAFEKKGDIIQARKFYESALKTNQKINDVTPAAENLFNLARLSKSAGEFENALAQTKESLSITDSVYYDVANSNLRKNFLSGVFDRYELYINLLMKRHKQLPNKDSAIQALQAAERSRARLMLENLLLSEANFIRDADGKTVKREKEIRILLNAKADTLTDFLSRNAEKSETDKISNEIGELEHELEEIKAELKQQSPVYSAIKNPAPFDVGEFQKNVLDDDSLLLEFSFGEEESYLWLIGKTEVNSYILPPREQLEAKIQTLRELLAAREIKKDEEIGAYQARIVKADADYWQTAKQLSDEIFGQVADKLGKNRLIIVPDGKLNYFPVSALPLPNSENNEPILLTNEVVYEPSASTLSILAKSQNQTAPASKNLLVFSDPVFTDDDSRILVNKSADISNKESASLESFRFVESLNSLARLTASKMEADSIIDILGSSNTDYYSGFSANREQLLNANAADYKIIHLATHGLINEDRPELSGIVLSRFDEKGQKLNEFVRLQDIYGMNLSADLVVLSACETGIGKEVRGAGLMSLNNAFLQVGAKSVMSSLWRVEDNATLELMKNFYSSLADEKITPSKALQKAQIKMWQSGQYKSPFYWAAFTLQGDYKRVPNLTKDFNYSVIFSAAAAFLFLLAVVWFFKRRIKSRLTHRK